MHANSSFMATILIDVSNKYVDTLTWNVINFIQ